MFLCAKMRFALSPKALMDNIFRIYKFCSLLFLCNATTWGGFLSPNLNDDAAKRETRSKQHLLGRAVQGLQHSISASMSAIYISNKNKIALHRTTAAAPFSQESIEYSDQRWVGVRYPSWLVTGDSFICQGTAHKQKDPMIRFLGIVQTDPRTKNTGCPRVWPCCW